MTPRGRRNPPQIPHNHSPRFVPAPDPAIGLGVRHLLTAATPWLAPATRPCPEPPGAEQEKDPCPKPRN
ncbi:hypothetical protein ACWCXX_25345 [Streptomyces sp. NPDC001732]